LRILTKLASLLALGSAVVVCSSCRGSSASGDAQASASTEPSAQPEDVVLPGVDISPMTPRERHEWSGLVSELFAPCPSVPVSVAQCVQEKRACGSCLQAAKFVARAVRDGASEEQVRHAYRERYDPSTAKAIPLSGSPSKGPDNAPVTVVEFADFECPHCRAAVPMIDQMFAAHPGKVRLVYKFVALPMHVHAEPAARAAFAAGLQGKFWEMEHLLFERQDHLEQEDLERYARILRLDVAKWKADMTSAAANDRMAQDRKLEDDLQLKGTPTIYINGRELDIEEDESLEERVAAELGVPPVEPSASGSAASPPPAPPAASGSASASRK